MGRPLKLNSETYSMTVACCNLIIIISFHEKTNTPCECFIKATKKKIIIENGEVKWINGGCHANQSAVAELTTRLLKNDLLAEAIDSLEKIRCHACNDEIRKAEKKDKPGISWSCPGAVARVLKNWLKENGEKEKKK